MDITAKSARLKPAPSPDLATARFNQYGELIVQLGYQGTQQLAEEGSYFFATSAGLVVGAPTPGVGVATTATPTTFSETSPFLLIKNNNPVPGSGPGVRVVLDYIRIMCTAPGTGGTSVRYVSTTDIANPSRYTSGGSAPLSTNVNQDDSTVSNAQFHVGAIVATTRTSQARPLVGNMLLKNTIPAVGDSWLIEFAMGDSQNIIPASVGTANHPAVIIGPQQWYAGHLIIAGQSAASSFEIEVGYAER
jgi:hypothetical protein